ncbi:MAG: prepilin-type N-terminal cleavage/methylation domain-containing protein [Patescibacteria group bacterium]
MTFFNLNNKGLTLLEILLSISIISILAGVLYSVLNPIESKNKAYDAITTDDLKDVGDSIEVFRNTKLRLPAADASGNPLVGADGNALKFYINAWPNSSFKYYSIPVTGSVAGTFSCISAPKAGDNLKNYVYISPYEAAYTGGSRHCANAVIICPTTVGVSACSGGASSINLDRCTDLGGVDC